MAGNVPRKRRTRQHVIAAQSVNHVERFIIDAGHTAQRVDNDYGYDLTVVTYDAEGYPEPGAIYLQLKASETLLQSGPAYTFDLDVRDYHLWTLEVMPVFLVLFDASRRRAYWLYVKKYFRDDPSRRPKKGAKTARIRVPRRQAFSLRGVAKLRALKQDVLDRCEGALNHG
jgi:hypothetical protein